MIEPSHSHSFLRSVHHCIAQIIGTARHHDTEIGLQPAERGQEEIAHRLGRLKDRQAFGEPISHRQAVAFAVANIGIDGRTIAAIDVRPLQGTEASVQRLSRADLRTFPTRMRVFSSKGDTDIDRFIGGRSVESRHPSLFGPEDGYANPREVLFGLRAVTRSARCEQRLPHLRLLPQPRCRAEAGLSSSGRSHASAPVRSRSAVSARRSSSVPVRSPTPGPTTPSR